MNNRELEPISKGNREFQNLLDFLVCNRSLEGLNPRETEALQGQVYEEIRRKMIGLFKWRGSDRPEELVDRTFDRVTRRLPTITSYVGDPSHYICGVGRLIFLESLREKPPQPPAPSAPAEQEEALGCLEDCMEQLLDPLECELILEYYRDEKRTKIERRERMARQLGTSVNSLRIRTCRIRIRLRKCVTDCLKQK